MPCSRNAEEDDGGSGSYPKHQRSRSYTAEVNVKNLDDSRGYLQTLRQAYKDNEGVFSEFLKVSEISKQQSSGVFSLLYVCSELYLNPAKKSEWKKFEKQLEKGKSEHRELVSAQDLAEIYDEAFIEREGKIGKGLDDSISGYKQDRRVAVPVGTVLKGKLDFLRLVKSSFRAKEKFEEYLKCLALYSDGITTQDDFKMQVTNMCLESSELIDGSLDLVRQCEAAELELLLSGKQGNLSHNCRKRDFCQQAEKVETQIHNKQRKKSKGQSPSALEASFEQHKKPPLSNLIPPSTAADLEKDLKSMTSFSCRSPCTMSLEYDKNDRPFTKEKSPHDETRHATRIKIEQQGTATETLPKKICTNSPPIRQATRAWTNTRITDTFSRKNFATRLVMQLSALLWRIA
ncbi:hypothetical protein L7F22_065161 [Adiantum nelumboides]|nr:hypothetical protein [Adiantum nelumboides]